MSRVNDKKLVVIDGNSIAAYASTALQTGFNLALGASNYDYINIAVGGQTWTNMLADFDSQVTQYLSRYREVIYVCNETRNELLLNSTTPADCAQLAEDYFAKIKAVSPNVTTYCTLCSAATTGTFGGSIMTDIPTTNALIESSQSGNIDGFIDIYDFNDFSDCLDTTLFSDGVHYTTTGINLFAAQIVSETT